MLPQDPHWLGRRGNAATGDMGFAHVRVTR
jgi:hypothetical protein